MEHLEICDHSDLRPAVYWYGSFRCNLACKHCWVNASPHIDTSTDLTLQEALRAIEKVRETNPYIVTLSGGEFLFRKDSLRIIEALIEQQLNYMIESNGILLGNDFVRLVKHGLNRGVWGYVSVSLDGGTPETHEWLRGLHTFKLTLKGLEKLESHQIPFTIQCVVNRRNIVSLADLLDLCKHFTACQVISLAVVNPVGRGKENIDLLGLRSSDYDCIFRIMREFSRNYQGKARIVMKVPPAMIPPVYLREFVTGKRISFSIGCSFPILGILPDGTITICAITQHDPDLRLGNINEDSLLAIWQSARLQYLRQNYLKAELSGICVDCVFRRLCRGACRSFARSEFGSFTSPHPLCHWLAQQDMFPAIYRTSSGVTMPVQHGA